MSAALDVRFSPRLLDTAYVAGLAFASPFLAYKMRTASRYRSGLRERLGLLEPRTGDQPCLWIHAASVGEVQACRSLVQHCRRDIPGTAVVLSTQTVTGQDLAGRLFPDCRHLYYPVDLSGVVERVFDRIRPSCVALVEREIWPNFVWAATRRRIPVIQVNGRLTEASLRAYRWLYPILGPALQSIHQYAMQTEEYADRLRGLAVPDDRILVTGNLKYDSVEMAIPDEQIRRLSRETGLEVGDPVFVCGSVHPPEVGHLIRAFQDARRNLADLQLVLVPRHTEKVAEFERAISELGERSVLKTQIQNNPALRNAARGRVLLVDTIGELRGIYALATVVFVGGTLVPVGGHNVLEPAALGRPVLIGPQTFKQSADVQVLLDADAAIQCRDPRTLAKQLGGLFNEPPRIQAMGTRAQAALRKHQGAVGKTLELVRPFLL